MKPRVVYRRWISLSCLWPCVMKFKIMFCLPWGNADTDEKIQTKETNVLKSLLFSCLSLQTRQHCSLLSLQPLATREISSTRSLYIIGISPQDTTRKHQRGCLFIAIITVTSQVLVGTLVQVKTFCACQKPFHECEMCALPIQYGGLL